MATNLVFAITRSFFIETVKGQGHLLGSIFLKYDILNYCEKLSKNATLIRFVARKFKDSIR